MTRCQFGCCAEDLIDSGFDLFDRWLDRLGDRCRRPEREYQVESGNVLEAGCETFHGPLPLVLEEDVVRLVRVEWRVEVDEIDGLGRNMLPHDLQVVAEEELASLVSHAREPRERE